MTNSALPPAADAEVNEDEPLEAQTDKGWSSNASRRRIGVAVLFILAGILAALFAWNLRWQSAAKPTRGRGRSASRSWAFSCSG